MKHRLYALLLAGVAVASMSAVVSAASGTITKELTYRDIKITLDGKDITPANAEPFIIDGTTYLPVRAVGEAMGLNVGWDGNTNTVILSSEAESSKNESSSVANGIDTNIDKCHVKYLKYEILENMAGEKCIGIFFEFTNNSSESKAYDYTIMDKAFQNGVELQNSWFHLNDESKNSGLEIKPGVSIVVCSGYVLTSDTADVEVEVNKWISFGAAPQTMTISLK